MNSFGVAVTGVAFAGAGVFLLAEAATAAGVACLIIGGMGLIGAVALRLRAGGGTDSRRGTGFAAV